MVINRRKFLIGLGGVTVGLPMLEGLAPKEAKADNSPPSWALFFRRGNGVQQALFLNNPNKETERWWPNLPYGAFTQGDLAANGRAHDELQAYAAKLGIVRGLMHPVGTALGHREGFIQGLTGAGVKYPMNVPDVFNCDPLGESLDNRIARELPSPYNTSLYMGHGMHGAAGVSFLNTLNAQGIPINNPPEEATRGAGGNPGGLETIFNRIFNKTAGNAQQSAIELARKKSVNDLVKEDFDRLKKDPRLSKSDLMRLDQHMQSISDVETALSCNVPALGASARTVDNAVDSDSEWWRGNTVTTAMDMMSQLAAIAIACGVYRSVLINLGVPQDSTAYQQVPVAKNLDFHNISHRQSKDGDPSTNIAQADEKHHAVDRFMLQQFKKFVDRLNDANLLDHGVAVHFSDLGTGQHDLTQLPYLYVGSAKGNLKTGLYVNEPNTPVVQFLNTIGAAVGVKNSAGTAPLDDFNADNNGAAQYPNRKGRIASISNM